MALLIMAIYTMLSAHLTFKITGFLRYSKCSRITSELTFTTRKANACSPWTACFILFYLPLLLIF